jgi:hypothetical protein
MNNVLDRTGEEMVMAFFEVIYRTFLEKLLVEGK